jgi:drug/metabolite transporter (DMT)-like permease
MAAERVAGTLAGGAAGIFVRFVGDHVPGNVAWAFYASAAGLIALAAMQLAEMPRLHEEGPTLGLITFLIIFASGETMVRAAAFSSTAQAFEAYNASLQRARLNGSFVVYI